MCPRARAAGRPPRSPGECTYGAHPGWRRSGAVARPGSTACVCRKCTRASNVAAPVRPCPRAMSWNLCNACARRWPSTCSSGKWLPPLEVRHVHWPSCDCRQPGRRAARGRARASPAAVKPDAHRAAERGAASADRSGRDVSLRAGDADGLPRARKGRARGEPARSAAAAGRGPDALRAAHSRSAIRLRPSGVESECDRSEGPAEGRTSGHLRAGRGEGQRPVRCARRPQGDTHRDAASGDESAAGDDEPGRLAEHAQRLDGHGDDAEGRRAIRPRPTRRPSRSRSSWTR